MTMTARFSPGDKVMVWGRLATVIGQYLHYPEIIRFRPDDGGAESLVITHFADGEINRHVFRVEGASS